MDDIKKYIGEKIRHERSKRGISAEQLAEILDVSQSYIGLIERGQRGTNIKLLLKICKLFNMTADEFLSGEEILLKEEPNKNLRDMKICTIDTLLNTLNIYELEFVIATIKNLRYMREDLSRDNGDDTKECFY